MAATKRLEAARAVRKHARDLTPEQQEQVIAAAIALPHTIKMGKGLVKAARAAAGL